MELTLSSPKARKPSPVCAAPLEVPSRGDLFAALTFLDAPPASAAALLTWFDAHVVPLGCMSRPTHVVETLYAPVPLPNAYEHGAAGTAHDAAVLQEIVTRAKERVVRTLCAFVSEERDERFLKEAVVSGKVRSSASGLGWETHLEQDDPLSEILLSLLAADVLGNREFHEHCLCVCKTCYLVSFQPLVTGRTGCREHRPTGVCVRRTRAFYG
jgi:hypothetical protein